jgi:hypothetical protein
LWCPPRTGIVIPLTANPVKALGYDEAVRNITDQEGVLEALRGRGTGLLSAAALVTSFLGGLTLVAPGFTQTGAFRAAKIGFWGWAAIGSFCLVGATTIAILWPWKWTFTMNPVQFVDEAEAEQLEVDELKGQLATFHWSHWLSNQTKLDRLYVIFRVGVIALVAETVFWILDIRVE